MVVIGKKIKIRTGITCYGLSLKEMYKAAFTRKRVG